MNGSCCKQRRVGDRAIITKLPKGVEKTGIVEEKEFMFEVTYPEDIVHRNISCIIAFLYTARIL